MKSKKTYIYVGSIVLVLLVVFAWTSMNRDQKQPGSTSTNAQPAALHQPQAQPAIADREDSANPVEFQQGQHDAPAMATRTEIEFDAAIKEIETAAITYDAEELPLLETYLYDPDPEIREAALDGMLVLGDAAASPLLRRAAENAYSPHEAVAMLEAADYLKLPSGTLPPIDKDAIKTKQQKSSNSKPINLNKLFKRTRSSASTQ